MGFSRKVQVFCFGRDEIHEIPTFFALQAFGGRFNSMHVLRAKFRVLTALLPQFNPTL